MSQLKNNEAEISKIGVIIKSDTMTAVENAFCKKEDYEKLQKKFEKEQERREKFEQKVWKMLFKYKVGDRVLLTNNLRGATITGLRENICSYDDFKYIAVLDYDETKYEMFLRESDIECARPNDAAYIEMLVKKCCEADAQRVVHALGSK